MEFASAEAARAAIQIPKAGDGNKESGKVSIISIYPHELPQVMSSGDNDIRDILERELAPLPVWRTCAVSISSTFCSHHAALCAGGRHMQLFSFLI